MEISFEKLIEIVIKEVVAELAKAGVTIKDSAQNQKSSLISGNNSNHRLLIDMRNYRTPVLTENHLSGIEENVSEIIVPKGTVLTPGAKEIIKRRKLIVSH